MFRAIGVAVCLAVTGGGVVGCAGGDGLADHWAPQVAGSLGPADLERDTAACRNQYRVAEAAGVVGLQAFYVDCMTARGWAYRGRR